MIHRARTQRQVKLLPRSAMRTTADMSVEQDPYPSRHKQVVGFAPRYNPVVHSQASAVPPLAPRLVNLDRYILGGDVYLHQSSVNYKPGLQGGEFFWHSDFEAWHAEEGLPRMRAVMPIVS